MGDDEDDEATTSGSQQWCSVNRQRSKKVKQQTLDEFCKTTGYGRGYVRYVLCKSWPPRFGWRKKNHIRDVLVEAQIFPIRCKTQHG